MKTKTVIKCNLDVLMKERGIKPEELADKAGVSRPTVYLLRANKASPSLDTVSKIANALGVTHHEILRTERERVEA
jgi:transcriptional regulator with XRE-family HTH domain